MALSTEELRRRLSGQQWTAHNIRLNDELTTWSGHSDFLATDLRLRAIERIFRFAFGDRVPELRIADLGSLEGGFALAFAQRGARVLGLEARKANFEKLALLCDHFDLPGLQFELGDVKDFTAERFGVFDAVLALGILYHLDSPAQWLRQASNATSKVIVIDTHFAPGDDASMRQIDPRISNLSEIETVTVQGASYRGRWFKEYEPNTSPEDQLWASYSNWRSFWLTKESLFRAVRDAGFQLVLEQHDYSADNYERFNIEFPRTLLVGIKL